MPSGNANSSPAATIEIKPGAKATVEAKKPYTIEVDTGGIKGQRAEVMNSGTAERLALMKEIFKDKKMSPPPFLEKPKIENKEQIA